MAGASENISREIDLTSTLSQMENIRLIADAEPSILINIQIERSGDITLSLPLGNVALQNRPANMNLVFTPADILTVVARANEEPEKALYVADVKASVDLSACAEEGSFELPVEIELPEGYELVTPVTLMVNSEKQEVESETGDAKEG